MSFDSRQKNLVSQLAGNGAMLVPTSSGWAPALPEDFLAQVRNFAYGLMVKGIRRGVTVYVTNATDDSMTFIELGCRLANLTAVRSDDPSSGFVIDASSDQADYIVRIGAAWSGKYKYIVDRTLRQIELSYCQA